MSSVKDVKVDVNLRLVKIPRAKWIIEAWKEMETGPQMVTNGFRKPGILDAIEV